LTLATVIVRHHSPLSEMVFERCPFCKKRFQRQLVDKALQRSSETTRVEFPGGQFVPPSSFDKRRLYYTHSYRCKNCGYEWTESVEKWI
jgi:hypothetical protein